MPQSGSALTLVSSNANTLVFSFSGASSGVTNGMILVNPNLQSGYTVVVTNLTEYAVSNTVVVLTRPAKLAELVRDGSLVSQNFSEITTNALAPQATLATGLPLNYHHDLAQVVYQDANLTIELLPGSAFDLNAKLDLGVNIRDFRLREFETALSGMVNFRLEARAALTGALDRSGTKALIPPVHNYFGTFIGFVPVWVELVYEINAGFTVHADATASYTQGITGTKEILVGRRWSDAAGWSAPFDSPPPTFTVLGPTWQVETTGNVRVSLQPKVTVYIYSAAGVSGDLQPYVELAGSAQLNPPEYDLGLYAGLTSTIGLNLRVWDDAWGEQPDQTFDLIPRTLLWHTSGSAAAPEAAPEPPSITAPPQAVSLPLHDTATFSVLARGGAPLEFHWLKDGRYLSDDSHITGSRTTTLRVRNAQTYDRGNYQVEVRNPQGKATSAAAKLNLYAVAENPSGGGGLQAVPSGMALIPAGSFQMGDALDGDANSPVHSVYVSAFYMDRTHVTKAGWDDVYAWAITHGYSFDNSGSGKAANHPVQAVNWYDSVKWCNARSEKEGRLPAYYTDANQTTVYRTGEVDIQNSFVKWTAGYRLPTEAEWEKAARGGVSGKRFPWGDTITHSQANYYSYWSNGHQYYPYDVNATEGFHPAYNGGVYPYASPVGSFAANGYGLYDMAGNVLSWCWDRYGTYGSAALNDPIGPNSGSGRVVRGGSWAGDAYSLRCADRIYYYSPSYRDNGFGFRCALGQP